MSNKMSITIGILIIFLFLPLTALAGDEVLINQRIASSSGTVQLSPRTYTIDHPIVMKSGVTLAGVPGKTTILLKPNVKWALWVPVVDGVNCQGIRITGINFDMNSDLQTVNYGVGYHNGIFLKGCRNIEIDHCTFTNGKGDGARFKTCSNVYIHDNTISRMGHDGIYVVDCKDVKIINNRVTTRTNSGIRDWNSVNLLISKNKIDAQPDGKGGYAGIQIEYSKAFSNPAVMISDNVMIRTQGPGVQLIAYSNGVLTKGICVKNNKFLETGVSTFIQDTGGISVLGMNGATITGNTFDSCYNAGVIILSNGSGTSITKNYFKNVQPHVRDYKNTKWTGYCICNRSKVKITTSWNTMSANLQNRFKY